MVDDLVREEEEKEGATFDRNLILQRKMSKEVVALEDLPACKLKQGTCLWYVKSLSE